MGGAMTSDFFKMMGMFIRFDNNNIRAAQIKTKLHLFELSGQCSIKT